jgi:hypothetical protein
MWIFLLAAVGLSLASVLVPAWIIQPFRPQTQSGLEISYVLRSWSPALTMIVSVLALLLAIYLWRNARRWWLRAALGILFALSLAPLWLARQNHFEWMFNPLHDAAYARADEGAFVSDTDMVMSVELNGEAVAYPVRQMAYHHIVQDVVGGTPVVATY